MQTIPLNTLPFWMQTKRYVVAYSGGLDSHVLLHWFVALSGDLGGRELVALHIDHGLSEKSAEWSTHCKTQCEALGVLFNNININARHNAGDSPEAAARVARYQAFRGFMKEGDCLLTAHHKDDQAETLLLQLLRGAGPRGLAAMPSYTAFAAGWHARPLLNVSRDELFTYAKKNGLSWIDDESNSDTQFDRNFLRHNIIPTLKTRFPSMAATLSRSAVLCAEATELLASAAANDTTQVQIAEGCFSVSALQNLGEVRARNVLHEFCRNHHLPTPSAAQLQCVWEEVVGASADSEPRVSWPGVEVRRYRDELFLGPALLAHDAGMRVPWDARCTLEIPGLGTLQGERVVGRGIALSSLSAVGLEIRFRQGGEKLRPVGREGHHALKKLFQEAGIPPWLRKRIPLLYAEGELLAVAGLWVAHEAAAQGSDAGLQLRWEAQD